MTTFLLWLPEPHSPGPPVTPIPRLVSSTSSSCPLAPPSCCPAEGCPHPQGGLYTRAASVTPDLYGSRSNPLLPHSQCLPQVPSPLTSAPTRASYLAFLIPSSLYLATRSSFGEQKYNYTAPVNNLKRRSTEQRTKSKSHNTPSESLCNLTTVSHTMTLQFVFIPTLSPHPSG